jgi:hypothetical protein
MPYRSDNWTPEYLKQVSVDGSSSYGGAPVSLDGASAVVVQAMCSGGASGTVYIEGTLQEGPNATWVPMSSQSVVANGSTYIAFTAVDALTNMHQMRARFVSSAAGKVTVAVNMRMTSAL